jgi:hypothetical protein
VGEDGLLCLLVVVVSERKLDRGFVEVADAVRSELGDAFLGFLERADRIVHGVRREFLPFAGEQFRIGNVKPVAIEHDQLIAELPHASE